MAEEKKKKGLLPEQKLKSYLILDWMRKHTDRNHTFHADYIAGAISDEYGISAERRSVYRDIDAINEAVLLAHEEASDIEEARELVESGQRTIVYDAVSKGYYYDNVFCNFDDIRLAAEAIYSAKFIDKTSADRLVKELIFQNISEHQQEDIKDDVFVSDRVRTANKHLWKIIETIREAMRNRDADDPDDRKKYKHHPEQISFRYLTHSLGNINNEIERGRGAEYIVSPYKLMFCDGNFYLLAYNAKSKRNKVLTYRVDRMRDVSRIKGSEREGWDEVKQIDLETYTQTHFNMFEGDAEVVTIRFTNDLLDAIYDRFGGKNAHYVAVDNRHFTVTTTVHLSNPFYGWVFAFGSKAKILRPQKAVDEFKKIVATLSAKYEQEETE